MANWRVITLAGVVGALVPVASLLSHSLTGDLAGLPTLLMWPSSIMMMATEDMSPTNTNLALSLSIAVNVVLYSVVGAFIGCLIRRRHSNEA